MALLWLLFLLATKLASEIKLQARRNLDVSILRLREPAPTTEQ